MTWKFTTEGPNVIAHSRTLLFTENEHFICKRRHLYALSDSSTNREYVYFVVYSIFIKEVLLLLVSKVNLKVWKIWPFVPRNVALNKYLICCVSLYTETNKLESQTRLKGYWYFYFLQVLYNEYIKYKSIFIYR